MDFKTKLKKTISKNSSLLCVGLDPDPAKTKDQFNFGKRIIDQTADLVCCYKPQVAFYAAVGTTGIENLKKTINYIHGKYKDVPVLLDAKRGDIGYTSEMYAKEVFDFLCVDAVTLNPYLGEDALRPFFQRKDKGSFVLCKTSNPSARDFQDLKIGDEPLYIKVAKKIVEWDKKYHNLFMVVGATYPDEMKQIRQIAPNMTFLVPGIGEQGGDLVRTLKNGLNPNGQGLIITSSRSIIYAQNPRAAAQKLRDEINKYR